MIKMQSFVHKIWNITLFMQKIMFMQQPNNKISP